MECIGQTSLGDIVCDHQLLILPVIISHQWEQVGVGQPPKPSHVLFEVLLPHPVHVPEPLHHHGWAIRQGGLVGAPKLAAPEDLS